MIILVLYLSLLHLIDYVHYSLNMPLEHFSNHCGVSAAGTGAGGARILSCTYAPVSIAMMATIIKWWKA